MSKQLRLDIHHELIVDNFAGGGGASCGIELALGRTVDIAINHDAQAVAMHTANHPETQHFCESVWDVVPREITQGRPVALVWLSPDCKHFSKAKGGAPVEKKIRGLAWIALRWAATVKPRVIFLENVEEFVTWGPLIAGEDGKMHPCPKRKGREFGAFVNALKRQGYAVEWREMRACNYGSPTIRKRLFLIARRDGQPIVWPAPTHFEHGTPSWRTAAECIDWSIPCPSIFDRKKPLADATCRRIAKGIMRYVVNAAEPFIVGVGGPTYTGKPRPVTAALHTLTTESHAALVVPVFTEIANASSPRSWSAAEPLRTVCAQTKGGHHALVSAFLAKHYSGVVGSPLTEPVHTVTSVDHNSLVTAHIQRDFGQSVGHSVAEPMGTVTGGGGGKAALVRAFLVKYYGSEQDPKLLEPLHTVTTKDRFGLVTVRGETYQITDIGMRMLQPRELADAQGFPKNYIINWGIDSTGKRITLTKEAQVRMIGNSVCPPMAAALVRANLPELIVLPRSARRVSPARKVSA